MISSAWVEQNVSIPLPLGAAMEHRVWSHLPCTTPLICAGVLEPDQFISQHFSDSFSEFAIYRDMTNRL